MYVIHTYLDVRSWIYLTTFLEKGILLDLNPSSENASWCGQHLVSGSYSRDKIFLAIHLSQRYVIKVVNMTANAFRIGIEGFSLEITSNIAQNSVHAVSDYKKRLYKKRLVDIPEIRNGNQSVFNQLRNAVHRIFHFSWKFFNLIQNSTKYYNF